MTTRKDLKLKDKFNISKHRYRELYSFCQQYPEWKEELKYETSSVKSPSLSGMPRSSEISNPTAQLAVRRAILRNKCEIVEQAAKKCHPSDYQFLIWNVTQDGASYDFMYDYAIVNNGVLPSCGKSKFYDLRRLFFCLLDKQS